MTLVTKKRYSRKAAGEIKRWGIFDRLLGRLSHIAQLLLLALGIFGYFYTVRPFYQNQLLSEESAKKTLEINAKNETLAELSTLLEKNGKEVARLAEEKAKGRIELSTTLAELGAAQKATAAAKDATSRAESIAQNAIEESNVIRTQLLHYYLLVSLRRLHECMSPPHLSDRYALDEDFMERCQKDYFGATSNYAGTMNKVDVSRYSKIILDVCSEFWPNSRKLVNIREKGAAPLRKQLNYLQAVMTSKGNPERPMPAEPPDPNLASLDEDWKVQLGLDRLNANFLLENSHIKDEFERRLTSVIEGLVKR